MKITIVGAGMAGLVAANMLRRHEVTVVERSKALPHNHTALLRFRSTSVSDATGIPFTKERVLKGLWDGEKVVNEPTLAHLNRYSSIVTGGELHMRSVFNLEPAVRWVAPRDFIDLMARNLDIKFGIDWQPLCRKASLQLPATVYPIVISTVPMPFMMEWVNWHDKPEFQYKPVWTIKARIVQPKCSICQTLYNTEPGEWYRATIHGQEITLEFMDDPEGDQFVWLEDVTEAFDRFFNENDHFVNSIFTECTINRIPIGKITPIDENLRKAFILYLTEHCNIYSLGRFACWRNILLDDVVQDVKRIETMIETGTTYEQRIKS